MDAACSDDGKQHALQLVATFSLSAPSMLIRHWLEDGRGIDLKLPSPMEP